MSFAAITPRLTLALAVLALVGCPDAALPSAPDPGTDGTSSSGGGEGDTRSDITATTIDPSDSLSATQGSTDEADGTASSGEPESSDDEVSGSSSDGGSSSDTASTGSDTAGSSSSETTAAESTGSSSSTTDPSTTSTSGETDTDPSTDTSDTGPCVPSGVGNYDACLDGANMPNSLLCGFGGAVCINDGGSPAFASVCSQSVCDDACDCPAAPPTGNSVVSCEDITGDLVPECYLDCSAGEDCPDDMACFLGFVCVHDGGGGGEDYGPCETGTECPIGDLCIVDDTMAPTFGVCSDQGCVTPADCPVAPPTGNAPVTCELITTGANDCFLECSAGQTCPDGMQCFSNFLCMWPLP